ncbi:MAG: hypothetical protein LUE24_12350 [Lachnospiraceae bacterium]|nr:hypothetical protein [Lachnospiraceae bacterium]
MSGIYLAVAAALVLTDLVVCFTIGFQTRSGAENAEEYFIGGKKTGTILLFLTAWASFSGAVFVFYTVSGGVKAVIYADVVHGTIQIIFAACVIWFGMKLFHFDFGWLGEQIMQIDPTKWDFFVDKPVAILSSFLTGLLGAISNPAFWNRAFAAKDVQSAKKAYGVTFFMNIILVFMMILLGIVSLLFMDQGDQALVWLILNKMPVFCGVILAESVLAACMSCADTHLNCAAANVVSDILDPEGKLDGASSVKYVKIATFCAGVIAIVSAIFGDSIYALGTYGYTVCGGVLIPAFVIGLICRDRKQKEFRSKMSVTAAKIGMALGIIAAILFEIVPRLYNIFGGGVIPATACTSIGMLIANRFCVDQTWKAEN